MNKDFYICLALKNVKKKKKNSLQETDFDKFQALETVRPVSFQNCTFF